MNQDEFRELVWQKSRELYRDMPWRDEPTLYNVLVSELMLQQTQVSRVSVKFDEFMQAFPTIEDLAGASLADVLKVWTGLGYNRRAKYLHEAAKILVRRPESLSCSAGTALRTTVVTQDGKNEEQMARELFDGLLGLPGVGRNTAAAMMNYVYEIPTAYVETNIRTVYFYHFFPNDRNVTDRQILELVETTMDTEHPREWFWALMDYGASLKSQGLGLLGTSKHYMKQSPLRGSVREVRGQIIRTLKSGRSTVDALKCDLKADDRFDRAFRGLLDDGLIEQNGEFIDLTGAKN